MSLIPSFSYVKGESSCCWAPHFFWLTIQIGRQHRLPTTGTPHTVFWTQAGTRIRATKSHLATIPTHSHPIGTSSTRNGIKERQSEPFLCGTPLAAPLWLPVVVAHSGVPSRASAFHSTLPSRQPQYPFNHGSPHYGPPMGAH